MRGGPDSLVLADVDDPVAGAGQLLVRVSAVGVNYTDGLLIRDQYQVKPPRPFSPGAEFSGFVEATGSDVTHVKAGDLVMGRCGWGALAERIAIDQSRCVRIPTETSPAAAAGFLFPYATSYYALRDLAELRPGETMLVLGAAGGVGSAAVDLGRALGARVVVAVSSMEKLDFALSRGATNGLVYPNMLDEPAAQQDLAQALKQIVGPEGAHVVFDPVGGPYSEPALRTLCPGGRHMVVGFAAGIPRIPLNLVLLKRCKVIGVDWRAFVLSDPIGNDRNVATLLAMWREGSIHPGSPKKFPFESAPEAIGKVERREALGKIVITLGSQN